MTLWNNNKITPLWGMMVLAGLCLIIATPLHAQQKQMKDESVVEQITDTVSEVADEVSEVAEDVSEVAEDVVDEVSKVAEDVADELSTITDSDSK